MTKLTEQWKKGELPEGYYYVNDGAEVTIDYYLCDYWERHLDSHIYKVLAPVPSYDEWQEKLDENTQLKEALKDCQEKILQMDYDSVIIEMLQKIDEALR